MTIFLFNMVVFLGSTLLFFIQPIVSKMVLPYFGGSPSVWTSSMLFFQVFLLAGYFYAHRVSQKFSLKVQVSLHIVLVLAGGIFLLFGFSESLIRLFPESLSPVFRLLGILTLMVGIPFLILSAGSPLAQRWFSQTGQDNAQDPYFLYAVSNAGSLLALLLYPFLVEPFFPINQQVRIWTVGYFILGFFFVLIAARAGFFSKKSSGKSPMPFLKIREARKEKMPGKRRLLWVILAFVPSSLMLGVTTHLTTDVASVPLLWVVPLAIYLISFTLSFSRSQRIPLKSTEKIFPIAAVVIAFMMLTEIEKPLWLVFFFYLFFFFIVAMVCHGRLNQDRPPAIYLTNFYLLVSLGGALGGIFNAILAPVLFNRTLELPLVLVLSGLVCGNWGREKREKKKLLQDLAYAGALGVLTAVLAVLIPRISLESYQLWMVVIFGIPVSISYLFLKRSFRFSLAIGAIFLASSFFPDIYGKRLFGERNFFGYLQVKLDRSGPFHRLFYGSTQHGLQFVGNQRENEPLAYYHRTGPFGEIFQAYMSTAAYPFVGVIGLGIGAMLAYSEPGQLWTFYEIDPAVIRISQDTRFFTHFQRARAHRISIIHGDARLQIRKARPRIYGLLVVDAFNSDAIPIHLITREAFQIYLSKLRKGGILAIHLTNKNLDLTGVVSAIADELGLFCVFQNDSRIDPDDEQTKGKFRSLWAALVRDPKDLGPILKSKGWRVILPEQNQAKVWTDDFSNILGVLKWK